jgi:N-acylneuraminate cytidylyltransferase
MFDSIVSVSETHQMFWDSNGPLYDINNRSRRQKSIKKFIETGSFFITSKEKLLKSNNRLSGNIGFVEIPKHRSFDIDDHNDLKIVKTIINSKEFDNE